MEWWITAILIFGGLMVVFASGMPVAFSFIFLNIIGAFFLWGGTKGIEQLIFSMFDSVCTFSLLPVPLFVLMGEVMFQSGMGLRMLEAFDKWMGRVPGRLSLLGLAGGALIGALSGSSLASTALLGTILIPEMEKRGYHKVMYLGPLIGSGGLDMIIPPSAMAVIIGSIAEISIGQLLIAGIVPGLILAFFYACYIIIRCWLQPALAPPYALTRVPLSEKILYTVKYVLPLGLIIFLAMGLLLLGVVTATEAAAVGCLGSFFLAAMYRQLNWGVVKKSIFSSLEVSIMMFMIFTGSIAFSQILAFSGASQGLIKFATGLNLPPLMLLIVMQVIILILGCFLDGVSILMLTVPIFMPILRTTNLNLVWIGLLTLFNIEVGTKTPPFGFLLFVMKGVAPKGTTMGEIYRSVWPFVIIESLVMAFLMVFPAFVTWLPALMRK
jgi:tripartite ATP-independent transporter DctM subunit